MVIVKFEFSHRVGSFTRKSHSGNILLFQTRIVGRGEGGRGRYNAALIVYTIIGRVSAMVFDTIGRRG